MAPTAVKPLVVLPRQLLIVLICIFVPFLAAYDQWCGKAYRPGDPAIDPGGRIDPPVLSSSPLLDLQLLTRYNLYLPDEAAGAAIVNAPLSYVHGQPYGSDVISRLSQCHNRQNVLGVSGHASTNGLNVRITRGDTGAEIATGTVQVDTNGTQLSFPLHQFTPSLTPYVLLLTAVSLGGQKYTASTLLFCLPSPTYPDGGTVTRIDHLYGDVSVRKFPAASGNTPISNAVWIPVMPYSFYISGPWLEPNPEKMNEFANYGYNVLHIIPAGGLGYNLTQLDEWLDAAEQVNIWIMFDMRWSYQNPDYTSLLINRIKARKTLLLWYTADEPDGQQDPLTATRDSYDLIKSIDPYHPVSLVLSCVNYHFQEYTAGADIILSDVYPIGTNTSWSSEYGTECNTTYGCCGCDNCHGFNDLTNVYERLDTFKQYQTQLGLPQKSLWGVPQAFGGQFWKTVPTPDQETVMTMLSINHGAKGIVMWAWPDSPSLTPVTSHLASILIGPCAPILLGAKMIRADLNVAGSQTIDVSAWIVGQTMLLSIVNYSNDEKPGPITLSLPLGLQVKSIESTLLGDGAWALGPGGSAAVRASLSRNGMPGLESDLLTVNLQDVSASGNVTAAIYY